MRIEWKKFNINNQIVEARVSIDEKRDRKDKEENSFSFGNLVNSSKKTKGKKIK